MSEPLHIVYYDGDCPFCNKAVVSLLKKDRHARVKFAPLQGATAQDHLPKDYTKKLETLVYEKNGKLFTKAPAVIRVLETIGGFWKSAFVLRIVPRFLSNAVYDLIARNRKKLAKDSCEIPPEYTGRLLP